MHTTGIPSDITEWMKDWVSCKNRQWLVSCASKSRKEGGKDTPDEKSTWRCEGRSYRERETAAGKVGQAVIWMHDTGANLTLLFKCSLGAGPHQGSDDPSAYWYWKSKYSFAMLPDYYFLITPELIAALSFPSPPTFHCSPRRIIHGLAGFPGLGSPIAQLPCEWAVALPIPSMGQTDQKVVTWNDVVFRGGV